MKWFSDFNSGNTELVLFDRTNNCGAIGAKISSLVLLENHLNMLKFFFLF